MFGKPLNFLRVAGFNIGLDISWFFIAILLSWTLAAGYFPFYYPDQTLATYWIMGITGMLGLFISVVLHELGHALTARQFNVSIEQITLFIFGGVAEMKQEPPNPKAEFLVAIAGPIVSGFLALFMYIVSMASQQIGWPIAFTGVANYLAIINAVILLFNLVPAFPLDGGRILRALLWWWKDNLAWATKISTQLGSVFGFTLIFLGIFSFITGNLFIGLWWMILGLFLHQAATYSRAQFYIKQELKNEKVQDFMTKTPISISPDISIKEFIEQHVYQSHHHLYPVTQNNELLGYVSLKEVKIIPNQEWEITPVRKIMVPLSLTQTTNPNANVLEVLNLFNQNDALSLLVTNDQKQLVGILTAQDIFKLLSIKFELEQPAALLRHK